MPKQVGWRYCHKCQAMFYAGFSSYGLCAAGGSHDPKGSWHYSLTFDEPQTGQRGWKHCNKCHALSYAASAPGVCSDGKHHDYATSFEYSLDANVVGSGQNNWRYCQKCQGLAFSGFGTGICSAGGSHNFTGSWDYSLDVIEPLTAKTMEIMQENAPDGFRFVVCNETAILGSGVGGFSRKAVDPPEAPAKLEDRLNIASMSKTITAAAVLSTLQAKNLSPDTLVAPFFPANWTLHPQVKKLTFRDFLTHRTGFDEPTDRSDYAGIRQSVQQGPPKPIQAKPDYRNINFATMRIVLPYLNSYNRFTNQVTLSVNEDDKPDVTLANFYIAIVNQRVLGPSNVATAGCNSKTLKQQPGQPSLPVLMYEYQQPNKQGIDFGDQSLYSGASGWMLSVVDLARFLQTLLFTEIIVSEKYRALMLPGDAPTDYGLGINRDPSLAGGDVYSHGAWIPLGNAQVAGWFIYFQSSNVIVVALSNAGHNPAAENWFERVKKAYTEVYG